MEVLLTLVVFSILAVLAYLISIEISARNYFKKRNVPYFGNATYQLLYQMAWHKRNLVEVMQYQYERIKKANCTIAGSYDMGKPMYTIMDPEMMKHVLVKDFDHFVNRRQLGSPASEKILSKMLISLRDEKWKSLRSKMSPTFTTGKIKRMFDLFTDSSKKLVKYVEERMKESPVGEIDLWEGYSKFTMDTIATVVCGIDSKAFDQKEPSVFEQMGKKLQLQFGAKDFLKFILITQFPNIAAKFGWTVFDKEMFEFFEGAIKASINHRKETGDKGNDFIQLLLEAREGKIQLEESELDAFEKDAQLKGASTATTVSTADLLDDDGIVANCVLFILAGFDTTQSLLLYCAYALALHPEIQQKLRDEVEQTLEANGGDFSYESLHKMAYLDMVINETLRFYPPAIGTDRECVKDYTFPGTDITVNKGCGIVFSTVGMHHDEAFYPDPEVFDPERFSAENKGNIPTYAYLPFGHGPRNCIGMRFALTEVKLAISELVQHFSIEPSKSTLIPMKYQSSASLKPEGGMWLSLKNWKEA